MGSDATDQADEDDDDDVVRITNEALRDTIRKSKKVLAMHRNLLEQISEKKKHISVIADSSIHNEQEPFSGQSDSSFSHRNAVSEGKEIGHGRQTYLDRHAQQSEFDTTYGEFIDGQNEYYESLESEDTDFSGSSSDVNYEHYLYEREAANKQDYVTQLSQVSEKEQSVNEGIGDNSSASGGVDVMNVILVAAECAPWSKTGGLGDVAGALPKGLAKRGHRVMVCFIWAVLSQCFWIAI